MLALRLIYLAFCAILRILFHLGGEELEREAELVVLRHEGCCAAPGGEAVAP
jgi:hypothetical protein